MAHMKTDKAGAAQALALARLLIRAEVPIRLRLLLPAADNLPSGASIAAALFLAPFAAGARRWLHFDFESWSAPATALRPEGANVVGLRATYAMMRRLYA